MAGLESDALKKAEALGNMLSRPVIMVAREPELIGTNSLINLPLFVAQAPCTVHRIEVCPGADTSNSDDVQFQVDKYLDGVIDENFIGPLGAWTRASVQLLVDPTWLLLPGYSIFLSINKTGMGYVLPGLLFLIHLEMT